MKDPTQLHNYVEEAMKGSRDLGADEEDTVFEEYVSFTFLNSMFLKLFMQISCASSCTLLFFQFLHILIVNLCILTGVCGLP